MTAKQSGTILLALIFLVLGFAATTVVSLAQSTPSSSEIFKRLEARPDAAIRARPKVSVGEVKRNESLRRRLPSIDIQTINFAFNSAVIPKSQRWKVGNIAEAIKRFGRRGRTEIFLLEGHTDAVGDEDFNLVLSRQRARALKRELVQYFGVRPQVLETEGYGESDLLVPTEAPERRNRRVTIRRISPVVFNQNQ